MKTLSILGLIVAVLLLAQPGQSQDDKFDLQFGICFDAVKFENLVSHVKNCGDVKGAASTQPPTDRQGTGGGDGFHNPSGRNLRCFVEATEAYDKSTKTMDAGAIRAGLQAISAGVKGDELVAAFDRCTADKPAKLNKDQEREMVKCFFPEMETICKREAATTPAPA